MIEQVMETTTGTTASLADQAATADADLKNIQEELQEADNLSTETDKVAAMIDEITGSGLSTTAATSRNKHRMKRAEDETTNPTDCSSFLAVLKEFNAAIGTNPKTANIKKGLYLAKALTSVDKASISCDVTEVKSLVELKEVTVLTVKMTIKAVVNLKKIDINMLIIKIKEINQALSQAGMSTLAVQANTFAVSPVTDKPEESTGQYPVPVEGQGNESTGQYPVPVDGQGNETTGQYPVPMEGQGNETTGQYPVSMIEQEMETTTAPLADQAATADADLKNIQEELQEADNLSTETDKVAAMIDEITGSGLSTTTATSRNKHRMERAEEETTNPTDCSSFLAVLKAFNAAIGTNPKTANIKKGLYLAKALTSVDKASISCDVTEVKSLVELKEVTLVTVKMTIKAAVNLKKIKINILIIKIKEINKALSQAGMSTLA